MNSKKKVARWVVFFAVVIFALGLGVSHAYDTSQPPLNYEPRSMAKESLSLLSEAASPDVLLIHTAIPWNSTADTDVLNALGYSFDIIDMDDVPNTDINEYQVVLVVNDQVQAFYDNYAANYAKFENYVNDGGTLVFFACDHGWANGNNYTDLPGGVKVGDRYSPRNIVSNSDHPIIKQELVDHQGTFGYPDQPLQNADMYGNYCSHNYFVESTLPPGADVLLRTNDTEWFTNLGTDMSLPPVSHGKPHMHGGTKTQFQESGHMAEPSQMSSNTPSVSQEDTKYLVSELTFTLKIPGCQNVQSYTRPKGT